MAPQDYDVRQSRRVLELQNSDLWLRPTDLSWHFPILRTIREEPFKNYRSRTSEEWKGKFEEAKKQKIKKNDDGRSYENGQTSSWSWYQPNFKGIHDDENNVCLWRATIFSSSLPLILCCLVLLSDVRDCKSPFFEVMCIAFCSDNCFSQGHPVSWHSWDVICVRCDAKGIYFNENILVTIIIFLTLCQRRSTREEKESLQCLWVLVKCLLCPLTYVRPKQKEHIHMHNWVWATYLGESIIQLPRVAWRLLACTNGASPDRINVVVVEWIIFLKE